MLSNVSAVASTGLLELEVTGRSRSTARTLTVTLTPVGFLKYVYYTDVEAIDPALYDGDHLLATVNGSSSFSCGGPGNGNAKTCRYYVDPAALTAMCSKYWYTGRNSPHLHVLDDAALLVRPTDGSSSPTKVTTAATVDLLGKSSSGCRDLGGRPVTR